MTREQWEKLSDKAKWDIKVALRGPDSLYGEVLKWYTTAVIRGQLKEAFRVGGLYNCHLNLVVLPAGAKDEESQKLYEKAGVIAWNWHHFTDHVATAARWMSIPRLWVEYKVWHAAMSGRSAKEAGVLILEAVATRAKDESQVSLDWDGDKLYKPSAIKELERHLKSGSVPYL